MKHFLTFIIVITFVFLSSCNILQPEEGIHSYTYNYTGYDEAGNILVTGSLQIVYENSSIADYPIIIKGTWNFKKAGNTEELGILIGEGNLQGSVNTKGEIFINLHPGWMDNNIYLSGRFKYFKYGNIEGTWAYSTYIGITDNGGFKAVHKTAPIKITSGILGVGE